MPNKTLRDLSVFLHDIEFSGPSCLACRGPAIRMLKLMHIPMHFKDLSYMCASMLRCHADAPLVRIDLLV